MCDFLRAARKQERRNTNQTKNRPDKTTKTNPRATRTHIKKTTEINKNKLCLKKSARVTNERLVDIYVPGTHF